MYFQYADLQVKDVINGGTKRIQVKYNNEQVKPTARQIFKCNI